MKSFFLISMSVLVLALAGCRSIEPTASPTATRPAALPIAEPTATPVVAPTETPIIIPTATATTAPTALPTMLPTEETIGFEDLPALVMAANQADTIFSSVSPDGEWQADIIRYGCTLVDPASGIENAYETLVITRLSNGVETIAAEQVQYCGGMGSYGFNDFFWSPNSRYYYFDEARETNGVDGMVCGLLNTFFSRIDVETGAREPVPGSGHAYNGTGILAGWDGQYMVVTDINAGEIGRYPFMMNNATLQSYQASPSGTHLVYSLSAGCDPATTNTLVVVIDLAAGSQTVIAESLEPGFLSISWSNSDNVTFLDTDGRSWTYHVPTDHLTAP